MQIYAIITNSQYAPRLYHMQVATELDELLVNHVSIYVHILAN